jgi:curved DNA-binding protein CbpA
MDQDFDQLNYYEMLDIKPDASAVEIRSAYNTAMQMYQSDSLVSYSFFSREERNKILALLEKAYLTLINEAQRARYNNELHLSGNIVIAEKSPSLKKSINIFDINRQGTNALTRKNQNAELKVKISQSQLVGEILSRPDIKGADLKAIREELGVTIETIHQETKIRLDYLNFMEEDRTEKLPAAVFLKGFVKAYLKSLCIEQTDGVSASYMNGLARKN